MKELDRRKFLEIAGATTVGLAGGSLIASGQQRLPRRVSSKSPLDYEEPLDRQNRVADDERTVRQAIVPSVDFEIRVPNLGDVEVFSGSGLSLGLISLAKSGGPHDFGLSASKSCESDELMAEALPDSTTPDLLHLLAGVPGPLVPMALHPLIKQDPISLFSQVGILVVADEVLSEFSLPAKVGDEVLPAWSAGKRVGNYYIRGSIHEHWLSCINRRIKHAGLLVHQLDPRTGRQKRMLFDIHVAAWWERNRPCFAVYESVTGFCRNVCDYPTWNRIARFVNEAVSRGVPSSVAWTAAAAIGVVAIGALTVIPGVPPPP